MARQVAPGSTCQTCAFFEPSRIAPSVDLYEQAKDTILALSYGVCRRYPPVPSERVNQERRDMIDIIGRWPLVKSDWWCGEYLEEIA